MSFQPNFSNFYPPNVLPRVELKYKAKDLLRGNWPVLIGVTLLFLLLTSFSVTFNYNESSSSTMDTIQSGNTTEIVGSYFSSSPFASLSGAIAGLSIGVVILFVIIAILSAILIDGVLTYCYTAWFVTLSEIDHSRPLTFGDFAEHFRNGVPAALAYIWQQIWLTIWSLIGLPGFLLMVLQLAQVSGNDTALYASIATGASSFAVLIGSLLYLAGMFVVFLITIRYQFIFQLVADGRGKVGPRQALRYSCAITKGHLKELVVLELSWIPWYFVAIFTFGLGFFYVFPYINATRALAYRWLRDQAFQDGRLDPAALGYKKAGAQPEAPVSADGPVIDV